MTHGYDKDALKKRLHRIEGQVRGIERMVDEDRYCIDILTQVGAVKTALERLGLEILQTRTHLCIAAARSHPGDATTATGKSEELLAAWSATKTR